MVVFFCLPVISLIQADELPPGQHEHEYQWEANRQAVALVEAAVAAIEARGEDVFPEFRVPDSQWFHGETYVFVWDLDGHRHVYPPDPANEQGDQRNLRDVGGKPIGRMFIQTATQGDGRGWVHYRWNPPGMQTQHWKSTYLQRVVAPSGREYLVGSGVYDAPMEKTFLVTEVEAAAELLRIHGVDAFDIIRDPAGRFVFHDTYVFVSSVDGIEIVNPAFPELEGRSLWNLQDGAGHYMVREFTELALREGSGWTSYLWPRPGHSAGDTTKVTYVQRVEVEGETFIVGAGIYE